MRNEEAPALRDVSAANEQPGRGPRSGRAVWYPPPLGRAEQRSSVRIKTLALFERSEFASVPNAASSARNPKGTDVARLFFGYFLLAKQKKVTRPPGRDPACHRSTTLSAQPTPSLLAQGTARRAPTTSPLTPTTQLLTPHSSLLRPHSSPLRPHSSFLTPTTSLLTPHSYDLTPHPCSSKLRTGAGKPKLGHSVGLNQRPSHRLAGCDSTTRHGCKCKSLCVRT